MTLYSHLPPPLLVGLLAGPPRLHLCEPWDRDEFTPLQSLNG